jgi:hypothetical protein
MRLPPQFSGLTALAVLATMPTWARACWEEAAQRYGISANLLYAIARVESNLNPQGRQPLAPPAHRLLRYRPHADQQRPSFNPGTPRHP